MDRAYLQNPLSAEAVQSIKDWQARLDETPADDDTLWVVADGAMLGPDGARTLRAVYGEPVRAFDDTPLADYGELGLLLWPVADLIAEDELAALPTTFAAIPCVSFVRSGRSAEPLRRVLAWIAGASTEDGLPLYLRIGDTRVLASFLKHMRPEQRAVIQGAVREWVWPDRTAHARGIDADEALAAQPIEASLVLDATQYAALLDDAAADMLHAEMRRQLCLREDERTGAELHDWFVDILRRTQALGLKGMTDQAAFAELALRVPGEFEGVLQLGDAWWKARYSPGCLHECIRCWGVEEIEALEKFWREGGKPRASAPSGAESGSHRKDNP